MGTRSAGAPPKAGVAGSDECVFLVFICLNKSLFFRSGTPPPTPPPAPPPSRRVGPAWGAGLDHQPRGLRLGPGLQLSLVVLGDEPLDVGQLAVQVLAAVLLLAVVGVGLQESSGRAEPHPAAATPERALCEAGQPAGRLGLPLPLLAGQCPSSNDRDPCSTLGQSPGPVSPLPQAPSWETRSLPG